MTNSMFRTKYFWGRKFNQNLQGAVILGWLRGLIRL